MNLKNLVPVLCCVGASTLLAGGAVNAQVAQQPQVSIICGGDANKSLTFGYMSPRQEATSGTAYPNGDCPSYVVDVSVPAATGGGEAGLGIGTGPANAPNKASCESYAETWSIRKTGADGKTSTVASGTRKGTWSSSNTPVSDPHCVISGDGYSFKRPASGTDKYRVMTRATLNGKTAAVKVSVAYTPVIK